MNFERKMLIRQNSRSEWLARRRGGRVRFAVLVLCGLFWWVGGPSPPASASSSNYDALRLITETLHEINRKYVWQKDEGEMIQGALRGMMHALDPDSSFLTPQEYKEWNSGAKRPEAEAGLELVVKDNLLTVVSVVDGSPAARADLKPGDHILKINGQLQRNLTTQEGLRKFQGAPGTALKLHVLRNSQIKPLELTVTLEPLPPGHITSRMLKGSVAYVRIPVFHDDTPAELSDALRKLKRYHAPVVGLILDLRNNARGSMEQGIRSASVLLGGKVITSARGRQVENTQIYHGKDSDLVFKQPIPIVVLVDQGTARAAEIVAGALQNHQAAVLLGAKTFGLCGITRTLPLKDGSALLMTVAHCYTPNGQKITGKGLEPEVAGVKPGPEAVQITGQPPEMDPWVTQALEVLKKGKPPQVADKS